MQAIEAATFMQQGLEVVDQDGDRFRYNKTLKCYEMLYRIAKEPYWIFWCSGKKFDSFEHESNFTLADVKEVKGPTGEQSKFGIREVPLNRGSILRANTDANGSPVA